MLGCTLTGQQHTRPYCHAALFVEKWADAPVPVRQSYTGRSGNWTKSVGAVAKTSVKPVCSIVVFGCGGFWLTGCIIVAQKERGWITKRLLSRL